MDSKYDVMFDPTRELQLLMMMEYGAIPVFYGVDANANIRVRKGGGAEINEKVVRAVAKVLRTKPYG